MIRVSTLCLSCLVLAAGCEWGRETLEETIIRFDNMSASDVRQRVGPLLSERGTLEVDGHQIRVVDRHENVMRVREAVMGGDGRSPFTANLRFGLILASEHGPVDANLVEVAAALRELVRFEGYQLIGERILSATEGDNADGRMTTAPGHDTYVVSAEVEDIRAINSRNGSVELTVRLRRENRATLFTTNVVVPVGQTVVLGRVHPDGPEQAVMLTVRPELDVAPASRRVATGLRPTRISESVELHDTARSAHVITGVDVHGAVGAAAAEIQLRAARQALNATTAAAIGELDLLYYRGRLSRAEYERALREAGLSPEAARSRARAPVPTRATPPPTSRPRATTPGRTAPIPPPTT